MIQRSLLVRGAAFCVIPLIGLLVILGIPRTPISHLSYDAIRYLAGAEFLLSEGQYQSFSGLIDLHWPPGTSLLYARAAHLLHRDPESLVFVINGCAFWLLAAALYTLLTTLCLPFSVKLLTYGAVLLNSSLFSMYNKLWSEPLFLPVWLAFLSLLVAVLPYLVEAQYQTTASKATNTRTSGYVYWYLPLSAISFGVAYSFRYAAVLGIPVILGVTLLAARRSFRTGVKLAPLLAGGFLLPILVIWRLAGVLAHPSPSRRSTPPS